MENVAFDLNEVFRDIISRMGSEGAYDRDAYNNFIDELLEEKVASAELDPDANIKGYSESLQLMWPQAEALLTKTSEEGYMVGDEGEAEIPESSKKDEDKS